MTRLRLLRQQDTHSPVRDDSQLILRHSSHLIIHSPHGDGEVINPSDICSSPEYTAHSLTAMWVENEFSELMFPSVHPPTMIIPSICQYIASFLSISPPAIRQLLHHRTLTRYDLPNLQHDHVKTMLEPTSMKENKHTPTPFRLLSLRPKHSDRTFAQIEILNLRDWERW